MAWTVQVLGPTNGFKAAGTSTASAVLGGANYHPTIGDLIVVWFGADNVATADGDSSTVSSVTDTRGHTYVLAREHTNDSGGAATGVVLSIWYTTVTTEFLDSDAVTANHASMTARFIDYIAATPTNANGGTLDATTAVNRAATDPASFSLTPTGGSKEYLWVYGLTAEGPNGDTDTVDSGNGWTRHAFNGSTGGAAASNICLTTGYQDTTASSTTADWTHTARDYAQTLCAFTENAAAATGHGSRPDVISQHLQRASVM